MKKQILMTSVILFSLLLVSFISAEATCQAMGDVTIICLKGDCNYPMNQKLGNISITIRPTLGSVSNINTIISICKSNSACTGLDEYKRLTTISNSIGEILLSCPGTNCLDYVFTKSGNYTIRTYVPSLNYTAYKSISVMPTLKLTLSCGSKSYAVQRTATCSWKVEDADKLGTFISASPSIQVTQGDNELSYTPGTNSIEFVTPSIAGTVDVVVEVNKEGYISDKDTYQMSITGLSRVQTLYVDNKKYPDDYPSGVSTTSHTLKFSVDESGQPVNILNIEATIRTPSGESTDLVFVQSGDSWSTTTNKILQTGQTYKVDGVINFVDVNKDSLPFEYSILTIGGIIDNPTFDWTIVFWIIGIVVVIIIILVVAGFMFRRRK